jgi:hypothetical protein
MGYSESTNYSICVYSSEIYGLKKALVQTSSSPVRCSLLFFFDLVILSLYLCFRTLCRMSDPFPEIKSKHSLVAKYVTQPIWDKLSRAVTATSGRVTITSCRTSVSKPLPLRYKGLSCNHHHVTVTVTSGRARATSGRSDIILGPTRRPALPAGPTGCDFVRDGRSMPPALTDHTTCPGLARLIYY